MRDPMTIRDNHTGIAISPLMAQEMLSDAIELSPEPRLDGLPLDGVRGSYVMAAKPAGTMPPPAGIKEAAVAALKSIQGENAAVLLDALGARLAFERTGTRLYEAMLTKARAETPVKGGPTVPELMEIWNDELRHFQLLEDTIERLGGDPTAITPTANVEAVASMGAIQVLTDPRMGVRESLHAVLLIELADRDSWEMLIRTAEALGQDELADSFAECLSAEERHLGSVRSWLFAMNELAATGKTIAAAE